MAVYKYKNGQLVKLAGNYGRNIHTYSYSEQLTNKVWVDGRPIYQKTMYAERVKFFSEIIGSVANEGASQIISISGIMTAGDNNILQLPFTDNGGFYAIFYNVSDKTFRLSGDSTLPSAQQIGRNIYLTVEYVK